MPADPASRPHHAASLPTSGRVPTMSTSPCSPGMRTPASSERGCQCPRGFANARLRVCPRTPPSLRSRRYRAAAPARRRRDRREHRPCRSAPRGRARRSRSPCRVHRWLRTTLACRCGAHEQRATLAIADRRLDRARVELELARWARVGHNADPSPATVRRIQLAPSPRLPTKARPSSPSAIAADIVSLSVREATRSCPRARSPASPAAARGSAVVGRRSVLRGRARAADGIAIASVGRPEIVGATLFSQLIAARARSETVAQRQTNSGPISMVPSASLKDDDPKIGHESKALLNNKAERLGQFASGAEPASQNPNQRLDIPVREEQQLRPDHDQRRNRSASPTTTRKAAAPRRWPGWSPSRPSSRANSVIRPLS